MQQQTCKYIWIANLSQSFQFTYFSAGTKDSLFLQWVICIRRNSASPHLCFLSPRETWEKLKICRNDAPCIQRREYMLPGSSLFIVILSNCAFHYLFLYITSILEERQNKGSSHLNSQHFKECETHDVCIPATIKRQFPPKKKHCMLLSPHSLKKGVFTFRSFCKIFSK